MSPNNYPKLKNIGNLTTPYLGRTKDEAQHKGIDIANRSGTPIPAFASGVVASVGPTNNGMGNMVTLKDEGGNIHQYGHLQSAIVKPGTIVKKGQTIAKMGKSGNSYSPSGGDPTHLDVRISDAYGRFKNPMSYLK